MAPLIITISGLRGIVGENLGPTQATEYGLAFGTFLQRQNKSANPLKVCVGRDSRPSGPMISAAVAAGLMATGCQTIDLGIVTTPSVALMTDYLSCDGAVIITASHNPVQWNGIKLLSSRSVAFPDEQAGAIRDIYHSKQFDLQNALGVASMSSQTNTHAVHIDSVLQLCDKELIASKRFKVVLDSINGAGCVVTAQLLCDLGCQLIHLNDQPTGIFAHTPEPTAQNLAELGPQIIKHNAHVGFAQDPDADRLAVIDEKGNYIGEEYSLALAAKYIFSTKKGTAATNLSTSRMIDDLAQQANCRVIRTPVGEANVANAMLKENCIIGGEGNGGVIDLRVSPVRDSLVGIVLTLQLMAQTGKTPSQLVDEIPRYHMTKTKLTCTAQQAQTAIDAVQKHFADKDPTIKIDTRDGIRIDLPLGWVHLRASNTEPVMRIIAETDSPQATQKLIDQIRSLAGLDTDPK